MICLFCSNERPTVCQHCRRCLSGADACGHAIDCLDSPWKKPYPPAKERTAGEARHRYWRER